MQDLSESVLLAVADNPITTKAVVAVGAGSIYASQMATYLPLFFSLTGSAIAGLAGFWLFMRHRAQYRLAKSQDALTRMSMEKTQLEINELKRNAGSA